MTRVLLRIATSLSLLVLPAAAAPSVLAGDPCYHGFEQPPATVEASSGVKVLPCSFEPTVAVVPVGGTVTFRSAPDGPAHLITGANQAWGERDVELAADTTVAYTFDEAGVYPYACALHRGMSGAIVVGDGGDALAAAIGPTGGGGSGTGTSVAAEAASSGPQGDEAVASATAGPAGDPSLALLVLGGGLLAVGLAFLATRRPARDVSETLGDAPRDGAAVR